jgi:poly-gamma-glutamate synthesis protein (capsule biosynthesis protein)
MIYARRRWRATLLPQISILALAGAALPAAAESPAGRDPTVTIVLVGDVGLNATNQTVDPKGVNDHGFQSWADTTSLIAGDINGDLNFLNVEAVVTDHNDLHADTKGQSGPFNFRMHPNGLRHLVSIGFNVLSLANNHSMDYGVEGLEETLRHVGALRAKGLAAAAGIGMNRDAASRPEVTMVKGSTIAFSAIGIVTNNLARHRAGEKSPGQIAYRFADDWALVRERLAAVKADLRVLSIHYGVEGRVRADAQQLAEWRGEAAHDDGIDLIVGHHAHVVRGVEMAGRALIFYGLGNFLHHGTANMTGKGLCRDFGLMARVHAAKGADGRLEIKAVEAIPVTDTHMRPRRLPGAEGAARVHVLNYLAQTLDDPAGQARGLRFTPQKDGSGLYCAADARDAGGRLGGLCRGFAQAPPIPESLRGRIAASCAQ